jgi:uncharacterized protein (TIGR02145 family)
MKTITLLLTFLFIFSGSKAQTVTVTDVVQDGQKLIVSYDITGGTGNYEVSLFCSTDDGTTWAGPLKSVSGDVGKNISASGSKKLTWTVLSDRAGLDGDKIRFKVKAVKAEKRVKDIDANFVSDIDGNTYETVKIGSQIWMSENLKTSKYRDGSPIPTNLDDVKWANTSSGAYAIYNNDPANNSTYGKLYNWYAVTDRRDLCPTGYHVPSDEEWSILENFLGGTNVAGGKMKTATGWKSPYVKATNESGWSGLPGGYRTNNGVYSSVTYYGYWWSTAESSSSSSWYRYLGMDNGNSIRYSYNNQAGFSVRCLMD